MAYQQYPQPPYPTRRPPKKTNPWLIGCLVLAGVGVVIVGGCTVLIGVAANNAAKTSTAPPPIVGNPPATSTGKAAKQAPAGHLGTPAQDNGVQLTGISVDNNPPKSIVNPTVAGHLVGIKVKVKNVGTKPLPVNPLYFKVVCDNDEQYPVVLASIDGQIDTADLAPGLALSGSVGFDIPKGVKPTKVVFTNEVMSDLVTAGLTG